MDMMRSLCTLAAGAAIGGALLIAYRISQETGKSFPEALSDVPAEVQRLCSDLRGRAEQAVDRGREACRAKEAEMNEHLRGTTEAQ
jgi:hypothetical protein